MAKLVDAPASGAGDRKIVGVRVPFWAPNFYFSAVCQGHLPVISSVKDQLKKQRKVIMAPKMATLIQVGLIATVRMISLATKISKPSNKARII